MAQVGRKRWVGPDDLLELLEQWARDGVPEKAMCVKLGISQDTFYKNKRENPEFSEALNKGRAVLEEVVVGKLTGIMLNDAHKGQLPALMFYLKTQAHWRERDSASSTSTGQKEKPTGIVLEEHSNDSKTS